MGELLLFSIDEFNIPVLLNSYRDKREAALQKVQKATQNRPNYLQKVNQTSSLLEVLQNTALDRKSESKSKLQIS